MRILSLTTRVACLLFLGITFVTHPSFAQDTQSQKDKIINSNDYYWGEGCGSNMNEASDQALGQLTSSIAVKVTQSYQNKVKEEGGDIDEKTTSVVQTYSSATIKNAQTIKRPDQCGISVFHYIPKEQVSNIFRKRKQLVRDIYGKAMDFEAEKNYAYALKWYYYAIVLMNSIPEQELYHGAKNLYTEVPAQISEIIQNVRFEIASDELVSEKEREIVLNIFVGDSTRAQTLDFSFWDGSNQVHVQARDGKAYVKLFGSSVNFEKLDIYVKYDYYQQRGEIKQVKQLWDLVQKPSFSNHIQKKIEKPGKKQETKKKEPATVSIKDVNAFQRYVDSSGDTVKSSQFTAMSLDMGKAWKDSSTAAAKPNAKRIQQQTEGLYKVFNDEEGELPSSWMKDAFLMGKLNRLKEHNNLNLTGNTSGAEVNQTYDRWELRHITGTTSYETLNIQSSENVVPDFDKNGNLVDVNFGVMDGLYEKFQRQAEYGEDWKERQVIIKFMEKYRTAYLTRDIEQLETLFAEEAVIIVGRVLKKENKAKQKYKYEKVDGGQPNVEYMKHTKEEYLKRQAQLFDVKEDIYLGFSTFNIFRKNNQPGIYGISLRQHYNSTGYSDEGYLFLLVDFNEDQPKIYVRSWQPQQWSEDALIDLANFNVNF